MNHKHLCSALLFITSVSLGIPSNAQKTYTPDQLRNMIQRGNYPQQGKPSTQSQNLDYASCIAKVAQAVSAVGDAYPTRTIVSTNTMIVQKVWTNDAAVTVTCSAADQIFVITSAPYL
jgi:hypothetical protein